MPASAATPREAPPTAPFRQQHRPPPTRPLHSVSGSLTARLMARPGCINKKHETLEHPEIAPATAPAIRFCSRSSAELQSLAPPLARSPLQALPQAPDL